MKKTIIQISETANRGKSMMISRLGRQLIQLGATTNNDVSGNDYRAVFEYKGVKVGLQSFGDSEELVNQGLTYFLSEGCEIIIIPTKRFGATSDAVSGFADSNSYRVIIGSPYRINGSITEINQIKEYSATHYAGMVTDIISGRI